MLWPGHVPAGVHYDEMMSHIDCWATLAAMVGLTPPPHDWVGNDGKPIYFDRSITARISSARHNTRHETRGYT
jgi:arylsulfatase A-like enzyme